MDYLGQLKGLRCFVTGASGFIGRRLVAQLAEAGADVTALVRSKSALQGLAGTDIRFLTGTMADLSGTNAPLSGHDVLFNLAYDVRASAAANLLAFDQMLAAATQANVGRIVHTSSIVVYDAWPSADITENSSMSRPGGSPYRQAKIEMERRLMNGPVPSAILQPTIVYGPGSTLWTDHLARALKRGAVVLPEPEGLCNGVYVDDVVQAALRAAVLPDLGRERFVISGAYPVQWSHLLMGYASAIGAGNIRHEPAGQLLARLGPKPDESDQQDRPSVAARVSAAARQILGRERFEKLVAGVKARLAKGGDFYPDHHLLEEFSGKGTCHIGHARERLGYAPQFDLVKGIAATTPHLKTL